MGFEPTNPYGTAASGHIYTNKIDWDSFKQFLDNEYRPATIKSRYQYATKYYKLLLNRDFSMLHNMSFHKRLHILKALAVLSKYLGLYNDFKLLMKQYGLRWSNNDKDNVIISRMLKPLKSSSVIKWIQEVNSSIPELKPFTDFMVYTGLRPLESIDSYNLITKLKNKIYEYYDRKQQMLQHFKYRKTFIRRTKKCYISFIPHKIIQKVANSNTVVRRRLYTLLQRESLPARFCDIREYWATYMSKYLTRPEIDFLQGRVSGSVFMLNYFNPSYITDLQTRTTNASKKLLRTIEYSKHSNNWNTNSNTPLLFSSLFLTSYSDILLLWTS